MQLNLVLRVKHKIRMSVHMISLLRTLLPFTLSFDNWLDLGFLDRTDTWTDSASILTVF